MEKKRIVFYVARLHQGGIGTALMALLSELSMNDSLDVTLIIGCKVNYSRFSIPQGINIIYLPDIVSAWFELSKKNGGLRKLYCLAVHFIGLKMGVKYIKRIALSNDYGQYDVAINYVNDIPSANCEFFGNDIILSCVRANKKISWLHNDPYRLGITTEYARERYCDFDAIVNVSNGNKEKFDEICPDYIEKSYVVYNCINLTEKVAGDEKWNKDNKFHIISVSRLANEQKRIDRIIDCCERLKDLGYQDRFVWHMFGSGPDEEMLKQYADEKKVNDVLSFEGETKKSLEMMSKADIYVMTSDYEGYSLTILEALAEELPVVVTRFKEAKESVEDGMNGYLADFDIDDICSKILKLMNNRDVIESMRSYIKENPVDNKKALGQFYDLIR